METNEWKNRIDSEFAIFFSEVEKNLPKTVEMASIGHEKIYQAMYPAYIAIREHLVSISELKRWMGENEKEEEFAGIAINGSKDYNSALKALKDKFIKE
jgi:hypothetical protein